jgi:hypothetical protein
LAGKRQLEFFLLRYVPDAVKGEFVNFGLVTLADGGSGVELIDVRFTKDRSRIVCLDPGCDLDVLNALQKEIQQEIGQTRDRAALMKRMEDSFSGVVQISAMMPVLTEKTALQEIDDVARIFLEIPKLKRVREPAGRQRILDTIRTEFEKAGVLSLMSPIPAEPYSRPGDPFEFDFGYRIGSELKMFHAVSMRGNVDSAVLLASRYSRIAPAIARLAEAVPLLTAVIENELDETRAEIGFALEMMRESKIVVSRTTEMPKIAEKARMELRV